MEGIWRDDVHPLFKRKSISILRESYRVTYNNGKYWGRDGFTYKESVYPTLGSMVRAIRREQA